MVWAFSLRYSEFQQFLLVLVALSFFSNRSWICKTRCVGLLILSLIWISEGIWNLQEFGPLFQIMDVFMVLGLFYFVLFASLYHLIRLSQ